MIYLRIDAVQCDAIRSNSSKTDTFHKPINYEPHVITNLE